MGDGMEESMIRVSLDRVEEGIAVLLTEDGWTWNVPADSLPEGSDEGDVIDVVFRLNPRETRKLADRVAELQRMLLRRTAEREEEGSSDGSR
ncbi:MAG: hypothetical protein AVO35_00655 [Candidatus Aegiribacteria sp. MLS_C]|nr:MAG: hypothetical protein AVO35_00655 [Candidatus Aegiribacteria sp. MLS_C]